jgi:hypothetical protein
MCSEVDEGDLPAVALRDFDAGWEILGDGVIELKLTPLRHVCGKERGEDFGDRPDLEKSVAVEGALVAFLETAIGDHPASPRLDDTDHDADPALFDIDPIDEDATDFGVRGC